VAAQGRRHPFLTGTGTPGTIGKTGASIMNSTTSRRDFLKTTAFGTVAVAAGTRVNAAPKNPIPRWRGFNLPGRTSDIPEDDFRMIRDFGFDWVRIPMNYWWWVDSDAEKVGKMDPKDVLKIKESGLTQVDRVIELGRKYSIHVNLNFHRAPGYQVNDAGLEPFSLWKHDEARDAFAFHWGLFAKRYKGIPSSELSFNLINEPPWAVPAPPNRPQSVRDSVGVMNRFGRHGKYPMSSEVHAQAMLRAIQAIREASPDRLIIVDGLSIGQEVAYDLIPSGVAQSVHTYLPWEVSHYRETKNVDVKSDFPENPKWPGAAKLNGQGVYNRQTLEDFLEPWGWLTTQGIGVHAGEGGAYIKLAHETYLRWMGDLLGILKGYNIGFAMWNFRGNFGVMDSNRDDVAYEDFHGHKLDRKMMTLLQYH
jgi:endoglucanase